MNQVRSVAVLSRLHPRHCPRSQRRAGGQIRRALAIVRDAKILKSLGNQQTEGGTPVPGCDTIRTDVVGSLLRPAHLRAARVALENSEIDADAFRKIEDEAIITAVRMQEAAGLDVVTDGEHRRLNFQDSFGLSVQGFDAVQSKPDRKNQRPTSD